MSNESGSSSLSRRNMVLASAAAAAGLAMTGLAGYAIGREARRASGTGPLKILILGGTGFLGPAVIDAAQARGHKVTTFNRGRREKYVGTRDNVEKLYGNRDPDKHADEEKNEGPKGLEELKGKTWDGVVDTSGYVPRIAGASAEALASSVGHYVFISTISVYKNNDKAGMDESDEIGTVADPKTESMGAQFENYGPLKALCEQAVEKAMPGRVSSIRAGFIVGPGDTTDRFTYWPVRVSKGGEVLVPGDPKDPVQFIDVRDLAEFVVTCIENKAAGIMNATGPGKTLTNEDLMSACLAACKSVPGSQTNATFTYASYERLATQQIGPGVLPILLPAAGEFAGFHTRKVDKAIKAGLKFRSTQETCRATLEWWPKAVELRTNVLKKQTEDNVKAGKPAPQMPPAEQVRAGLPIDREMMVLSKLKEPAEKK